MMSPPYRTAWIIQNVQFIENLEVYKDMLKKQFSMKLASTQLIANPDDG